MTVTEEGSCSNIDACGYGPYWIGETATGSYIFTFSAPVPEVRVSLAVVNDVFGQVEEVSFEVNGNFYAIINPGVDDGCRLPCIISGTGTIRCGPGDFGQGGSWQDIIITGNITTLKITNTWLGGAPNGSAVRVVFCCPVCPTDAGTITADPLNLCPDGIAIVPAATQPFLDNNDLLQYILFSDLNDTLGSIISTSNTPSFLFTPATMQLGTSYYIAAIAGNNVGGNVDLTDNCLDISNAIEVIWIPYPSVTFSVSDPDVCAGNCTDVTATFTGTPPFTLSYTTSGNPPTNVSFTGNTGIFQVCVDADAPPGNLVLQATNLIDANCTCN